MPLLKIFSRRALTVDTKALHARLVPLFDVPESVLQVIYVPSADMHPPADLYVDIRAKAKESRTPQMLQHVMASITETLASQTGAKDIKCRVELYEPSLQHSYESVSPPKL